MAVRGHLGDDERVRRLAAQLAQREAAAHVDRRAALEVGEGEGGGAVAAVGRAHEREERLVLVDRQQLPVAERPPPRCEAEADDPDLCEVRGAHRDSYWLG